MRLPNSKQWKTLAAQVLVLAGLMFSAQAETITDMNLRAAINDGRREEAIRLIEGGADVNGRTSGGYTPLMIAAGVGDEQLVKLLLARGADPSLVNDYGWSASYLAEINNYRAIQKLLQDAAARPPAKPEASPTPPVVPAAPPGNGPDVAVDPGSPTTPVRRDDATARDSHGWPKLGAYQPGQSVLYSGNAGKNWEPGTVASIDPTYGYNLENRSGSTDAYCVVHPQRESFWTAWFVGDWRITVPMAMNLKTSGGDLYRVVSGGRRLPPLRINKDGTYSWRFEGNGSETLLVGRWVPNPSGPGVILKSAAHGADWLVYNNTLTGSGSSHTVILSSDKHTNYDGARLR